MKRTTVEIFSLLVILGLTGVGRAQGSATNLLHVEIASVKPAFPVIEIHDLPITEAIQRLARDSRINYVIAPVLVQKWASGGEPNVNFTVKNESAKELLRQMLSIRHMALLEDPVSNIALIVPAGEAGDPLLAGLPGDVSLHTNSIPLMQFADVPLTTAIEHLANQEDINYMVDPNLTRLWDGSAPDHVPEPTLSFRLENVTAWGALNRILGVHGCIIVEDPLTHIYRVTFGNEAAPAADQSLTEMETAPPGTNNDVIPIIQFSAVDLDDALEHLFQAGGMRGEIDPRLKDTSDPETAPPPVNVRWTGLSAWQAIIALCENYDLTIRRDEKSGIIRIAPGEIKRHHHLELK